MSERPSPGSLRRIRHALEDAVIEAHSDHTIAVRCVSPSRARALRTELERLQRQEQDR